MPSTGMRTPNGAATPRRQGANIAASRRARPGGAAAWSRSKGYRATASYRCDDCGFNTLRGGEFTLIDHWIWEKELKLGWEDNLCIGCIEARLGRRISIADMGGFPSYEWMSSPSERLIDRNGFKKRKRGAAS